MLFNIDKFAIEKFEKKVKIQKSQKQEIFLWKIYFVKNKIRFFKPNILNFLVLLNMLKKLIHKNAIKLEILGVRGKYYQK